MSEKIEKLTSKQEARLPEYRDEGIKVGLDTGRMDRDHVRTLVGRVYREVLDKDAVEVVFAGGPREGYEIAKARGYKEDMYTFYGNCMNGSLDTNWVYTFKYFEEIIGLKDLKHVQLMVEVCKHMGQWAPFEECCIVMEKPLHIKKDDEGLLHCEDGPAIEYADGFTVYAWHGQRIPKEWIEDKENLKPETALTWPQIEQRRAAAEILGWNNVLKQLPTKVIDKDADPEIGELIEVDIPEIGTEWFLRVLCGTGREFAIPVDKDAGFKTALDANAWTYGMDAKEFMPEVRT